MHGSIASFMGLGLCLLALAYYMRGWIEKRNLRADGDAAGIAASPPIVT